jgi:hypothetical protein
MWSLYPSTATRTSDSLRFILLILLTTLLSCCLAVPPQCITDDVASTRNSLSVEQAFSNISGVSRCGDSALTQSIMASSWPRRRIANTFPLPGEHAPIQRAYGSLLKTTLSLAKSNLGNTGYSRDCRFGYRTLVAVMDGLVDPDETAQTPQDSEARSISSVNDRMSSGEVCERDNDIDGADETMRDS